MSYLILATDKDGGLSKQTGLPWSRTDEGKADMAFFRKTTLRNIVIMGYTTYKAIGGIPLKNRQNYVVTKTPEHLEELNKGNPSELMGFGSLDEAVERAKQHERDTQGFVKGFIIGGNQIYQAYLKKWTPRQVLYSRFSESFDCDLFACKEVMPYLSTTGVGLRSTDSEEAYLDLLQRVLDFGKCKEDRTGTGTRSLFGGSLKFSLRNGELPLLTSKRVAFKRGVIPELVWFVQGQTDSKLLEEQGCNIWKGNTSREFLDSRGLTDYEEGELGPGYGFQWRHSGAEYEGKDADYRGKGVDQLQGLVDALKQDPDSRRMLMSAWNPAFLDKMALPPCHVMYQVYTYVDEDTGNRRLCAKMYQRSADLFLGVPFNIASYALLTHLLGAMTGYEPDTLELTFGDAHVYANHIEQVQKQLARRDALRPYPIVKVTAPDSLDDLTATHFEVLHYDPHPGIKAPMAV